MYGWGPQCCGYSCTVGSTLLSFISALSSPYVAAAASSDSEAVFGRFLVDEPSSIASFRFLVPLFFTFDSLVSFLTFLVTDFLFPFGRCHTDVDINFPSSVKLAHISSIQ